MSTSWIVNGFVCAASWKVNGFVCSANWILNGFLWIRMCSIWIVNRLHCLQPTGYLSSRKWKYAQVLTYIVPGEFLASFSTVVRNDKRNWYALKRKNCYRERNNGEQSSFLQFHLLKGFTWRRLFRTFGLKCRATLWSVVLKSYPQVRTNDWCLLWSKIVSWI